MSKDEMIKAIEDMSVMELSELVKALEEKFGVSGMPMMAASNVAGATGGSEAASDAGPEQTTFNVMLTEIGGNKISVIKAVRELVPTLGLADAKALVEAAPKEVMQGVNKKTADEAKAKLEAAGAKAELK